MSNKAMEAKKEFRIVYAERGFKTVPLEYLAGDISFDCEIFDLRDGEVYLGRLSGKAMAYISLEVATACLEKNLGFPISSDIKDCIDICRKWFHNYETLPESKIKKITEELSQKQFELAGREDCYSRCILAIKEAFFAIFSVIQYNDSIQDREIIVSDIEQSFYSAMEYVQEAYLSNDYSKEHSANERKRLCSLGEFIISFMKSDKYLFIV